jgi:hypothetical protein
VKEQTMTAKIDFIEKYLNANCDGWATKYVLIAVVEDGEGDQSFFIQCSQDQTAAETIGLCEAVSHIQKAKIAQAWINRETEETEDE